jgi:hypothetical protein
MRIGHIHEEVLPNFVRVLAAEGGKRVSRDGYQEVLDSLTSFVVDMYVASTAWPVFSMAPDRAPLSFRLKPFKAAPRSA